MSKLQQKKQQQKRQQKTQKKKEREREIHKKTIRRRLKIREAAKVESDKEKEEMNSQAIVNRHTVTVCHSQEKKMSEEEIKEKLLRNMEILQALEQEYDDFQKKREEGQKNPPDFSGVAIGHEQAKQMLGGEAECSFKPLTFTKIQ